MSYDPVRRSIMVGMANRMLSSEELVNANALLEQIRTQLKALAGTDSGLLFAYRRKVYKELTYDERGKPAHRVKLKALKRGQQGGLCAECGGDLPEKYAVLDRLDAQLQYTEENTRLLCPTCDAAIQAQRGYS